MERALLSVGLVLLCVLAGLGIWWGWRHRGQRQASLVEPPAPPAVSAAELVEPLTGLYVSTTTSGHWQDRIVAHGLGRRAPARVHLTGDGVLIDRERDDPIFIPLASITGVDTAPGIAGKVMAMKDGILVITWDLGGTALDSGIRADDLDDQDTWKAAAEQLLGTATTDGASA